MNVSVKDVSSKKEEEEEDEQYSSIEIQQSTVLDNTIDELREQRTSLIIRDEMIHAHSTHGSQLSRSAGDPNRQMTKFVKIVPNLRMNDAVQKSLNTASISNESKKMPQTANHVRRPRSIKYIEQICSAEDNNRVNGHQPIYYTDEQMEQFLKTEDSMTKRWEQALEQEQ